MHHLLLRSIPELIVGLGTLELFERVDIRALVGGVKLEGVLRPLRTPFERVVQAVVVTEVVCMRLD